MNFFVAEVGEVEPEAVVFIFELETKIDAAVFEFSLVSD